LLLGRQQIIKEEECKKATAPRGFLGPGAGGKAAGGVESSLCF